MGRELFDAAFKEYARRWAFKQPYPADFFPYYGRCIGYGSGLVSGEDGFYTTDHVDLSISDVKMKKVTPKDPLKKQELDEAERATARKKYKLTQKRNSK
jgi:hypothetical protein